MDDSFDGHCPHLSFTVKRDRIPQFFFLLQQGVRIRRRVGCSVAAFLRDELDVSRETLTNIQSIMLDGKPVDDLETSLLHDGSTLALSAALPGLVGATLRRGGAYSVFRSGITYQETGQRCEPEEGMVRVKVFNLLLGELGPGLLRRGVFVDAADLANFLTEHAGSIGDACGPIRLDGKDLHNSALIGAAWMGTADEVFLSVSADERS